MYRTYTVYRLENRHVRALIGSVAAQSPEEAIFRLVGGAWGRRDYRAERQP